MLIDWFTVSAQIINFLILIALLKHFLYGPIIRAVDEREKKIASRIEEAKKEKKKAAQEAESFHKKNQELSELSENLLSEAKKEAEVRRAELVQQARKEVTSLKTRWQEAIQREKESFIRELSQMAGKQIYAITRHAFEDLADVDLDERIVKVFLLQIRNMKQDEKNKFVEAIKKAKNDVLVRSPFDISTKMQQQIASVLNEQIGNEIKIRYETAPELILGIELKTRGRKVSWNLENYLEILEDKTREALDKKAQATKMADKRKATAEKETEGKGIG